MTPEARGNIGRDLSRPSISAETGGVAAGAFIFDRFGGAPLFAVTAIFLPVLRCGSPASSSTRRDTATHKPDQR